MRFMLFICAEPDLKLSSGDEEALPRGVEAWATDLADRGIRLMGHVFAPISEAKTVRQRNGDLLVTDGPLAEHRNRSRASTCLSARRLKKLSRILSRHPMAKYGSLELRAIAG